MSNLKKKFNEIIQDLEKNIKNKEDLDYIKSKVYNISLLFLDEMDRLAELSLDRMSVMLEREKELGHKIARMEKVINEIEKEVFISQEGDFEIICPYCNSEFVADLSDGMEHEVKCPECGNSIELDWHEEENCGHNCGGECSHCHDEYEGDEEIEEQEDDDKDEDDM